MQIKSLIIGLGAGFILALLLSPFFAAGEKKQSVLSGKQVYDKKCASCHGKQGEGNPKIAKTLKSTIRNLGEIIATPDTLAAWKKITMDGKKKMPAFKAKLSTAEVDSVMAYLPTLAKPGEGDSAKAGDKK